MKKANWLLLTFILLSMSTVAAASDLIAGIAIAQDDHVYVWHMDGTVTVGSAYNFEKYSHARPYTLAPGKHPNDIVALSIAGSNNHVYVWYRDGLASSGTATNLTEYRQPYPYSLPTGKTVKNIVGIGIAKDDRVFTWYDDLTFTIGTSSELGKSQGSQRYSLPAGQKPRDVVEIDIAKSIERVHAWYKNGLGSSGTAANLGGHEQSYGYVPAEVLYHWWGPSGGKDFKPISIGSAQQSLIADGDDDALTPRLKHENGLGGDPLPGGNSDPADTAPRLAPPSGPPGFPSDAGKGPDQMIAAGNQYLIVSNTGRIEFLDKQGNRLPQKNGVPTSFWTADFFNDFVAEVDGGNFNESNLNLYLQFPKPCDSPDYPQTDTGKRFCISQFYDTRVLFDPQSKRFFIISNSRHRLYLNVTADDKEKFGGACGRYVDPNKNSIPTNEYCSLARRYVAFAVSKTEDPRDGFHQYIFTESSYRDFPWMAVNAGSLVITHKGADNPDTPVATVFSVEALKNGVVHPPYFRYYSKDVDNQPTVLPPVHFGQEAALTFLLGASNKSVLIFAFRPPLDPWTAPPLQKTVAQLESKPPALCGAVFRNNRLHLVGESGVQGDSGKRINVRVVRIPLAAISGSQIKAWTDPAKGFVDSAFGRNAPDDPPGEVFNYRYPSIAVNKQNDMVIGFGRTAFAPNPFKPDARYSVWYGNEVQIRRSRLLQAGESQSGDKIDYTTAVVDPSDDQSFWVAIPYAKSGGYRMVIAKITP